MQGRHPAPFVLLLSAWIKAPPPAFPHLSSTRIAAATVEPASELYSKRPTHSISRVVSPTSAADDGSVCDDNAEFVADFTDDDIGWKSWLVPLLLISELGRPVERRFTVKIDPDNVATEKAVTLSASEIYGFHQGFLTRFWLAIRLRSRGTDSRRFVNGNISDDTWQTPGSSKNLAPHAGH
jgi:hypothetical protein